MYGGMSGWSTAWRTYSDLVAITLLGPPAHAPRPGSFFAAFAPFSQSRVRFASLLEKPGRVKIMLKPGGYPRIMLWESCMLLLSRLRAYRGPGSFCILWATRLVLVIVCLSAQIGVATAQLLPAISITGTFGGLASTAHGHNLAEIFSLKGLTYAGGPAFQWNILNYGQITNNVRLQDATLQQYLIDYQNTVLKAQKEVEDGISSFVQSRAVVAFLRKSVDAAKGALKIATLEYQKGTRSPLTAIFRASARRSDWERSTRTSCRRRSTGCASTSRRSRRRSLEHLSRRPAGALRRVFELCGGALPRAGPARLQPRRQEGQAADRPYGPRFVRAPDGCAGRAAPARIRAAC